MLGSGAVVLPQDDDLHHTHISILTAMLVENYQNYQGGMVSSNVRRYVTVVNYEDRRQALEAALNGLEQEGGLRSVLANSVARIQALVVELDRNGEPVLPAPWIKWLSSEAPDFIVYNSTRLYLPGDKLLKPEEFGTLLDPLHPAYNIVRQDYARRGLRLNKSVRLYGRSAVAKPSRADSDTGHWSDVVEHLVGAVNALPAAQRAVVIQRLHTN